MRLSQIAISAADLRGTHRWYREVLGLASAGGTNLFAGPLASMVQGLPRAASTCWWLVDRQDGFQIELFEFRSPLVRRRPGDWRPCDVGYSMISFAVADLDRAMDRATEAGTPPLTEPIGAGESRRVCVRDPEGVLIELMEDDPRAARARDRPRPELDAVARAVTLSVPDLERSRRLFADVLGLRASGWRRAPRAGARGALGTRGSEAQVAGALGRRRARRAGRVHGTARQAMASRPSDLRPGVAQHRLRLPEADGVRGGIPALSRGRPARKRPARAARSLVGDLRERRSGVQRRAPPRGALVRGPDGVSPESRSGAGALRRAHAGSAAPAATLRDGPRHRGGRGPRHGALPPRGRGRNAARGHGSRSR